MPQLSKRSVLTFILRQITDLDPEQIIRVENHKNDRYLEIKKLEDNMLQIKEDGYDLITHNIVQGQAKSLLNRLIDYEFPRSHKLRIKIRKPDQNNDLGMSPWSARKIS